MAAETWNSIHLPKTSFSLKANLPQRGHGGRSRRRAQDLPNMPARARAAAETPIF